MLLWPLRPFYDLPGVLLVLPNFSIFFLLRSVFLTVTAAVF
jgi:hypothetical protein